MKNHYIKTNIRTSTKLYNELESTIYSLLIEDELISEENLVHMIIRQIKKEHGSMIYSSKEVRDSIKNLIDRKMIKEVVGPKLSKFINAQ